MDKKMEDRKEVKKSKRARWAAGNNLRQLKIFHSQDRPAKVGLKASYYPQSKISNSIMVVSEGRSYMRPSSSIQKVVPYLTLVPWRSPPEIRLSSTWLVAAGEESEERKVQMQRILTAPSSSIALDMEDQYFDDSETPVIPIIAIEEAEKLDLPFDELAALGIRFNSQPPNLPKNPSTSEFPVISQSNSLPSPKPSNWEQFSLTTLQDQSDPSSAIAAMKLKELSSLIDSELLINLLSNPKMTEKLVEALRLSSSSSNGTSEPREMVLPLPRPKIHPSLLINKSTFTTCIPANSGTEAIHRPLLVNQSSAPLSKTTETGIASGRKPFKQSLHLLNSTPVSLAQESTTETGIASERKAFKQSLHLLNSTPVSLAQESTGKDIQQANVEHEAPPRSVNQQLAATGKIQTCIGPKLMTTSVPLPSSTSDLLSKNISSHPLFPLPSPLPRAVPVRTALQESSLSLMRTSVSAPKDPNYLRSLIRQHGGANQSGDPVLAQDQKRNQKPCKFHNSSRGCRNGSSCLFLHDVLPAPSRSDNLMEVPSAKRMKLD